MIMTEIGNIFESLGLYVGIVVVLMGALYYFIKSALKQNEQAMQIVKDANDRHINYLQNQTEKLTEIISDCTKALTENTRAFQSLSRLLEDFKQQKKPD